MIKRILAIDIGNTSATVGYYAGGRLLDFKSMKYGDVPKFSKKYVKSGLGMKTEAIISSVFPEITNFLKSKLQKIHGIQVRVVGRDIPIKIRHNYKNDKGLGMDRKVNVYGAVLMYRLPMLVIDYGTAITFDYIDTKGIFCGGMIIPGPETSYTALKKRASLLPKHLKFPSRATSFLGRNTRECMESGILEGYGAMTDELILRFKKRYGKHLRVLATGGLAAVISPYTKHINTVDPKHSIKSLLALWRNHSKP